ncbi:sterol carrier family protein [Streptomyces sp. HNM0663]|uniref:Sterol carrier family protein n=1 Tax=Streptomyces chengmaiensis TaxID=3040919 RepID=A0ABT6HZJ9_9ACTN|nr:maleylpyruvate isomerase family mycothiol-dependent enzyme [Streptomyces chengmaiensis]MDH2393229.1 sterol carrier family protein [Streptomyces chengmaiensis]
MPPAKKLTRRYDPAKTRAAVLAQIEHVGKAIDALTPEQLALPTRLGDWTVRELAAHLALGVRSLVRGLEQSASQSQLVPEVAMADWALRTGTAAGRVDEDTRELAVEAEPAELFARAAARARELVPLAPDDRLVPMRFGAMRLDEFLVTRTVELIVHTDDLADATGVDIPYDRQALAACTRLLADVLAVKAPGASTEVRVPPFAVVQCVEGPRHTRGTPPNVVETDPLTWVRLATGRMEWSRALDAAKVSASGERADLSALLPVVS